jgi:hypothetical protein
MLTICVLRYFPSFSVFRSSTYIVLDTLTTIVYNALMNKKLYGETDRISGDNSGLYGRVSGIRGDATGLIGNCTHIYGDCTGIIGDLDSIPRRGVPIWISVHEYADDVHL